MERFWDKEVPLLPAFVNWTVDFLIRQANRAEVKRGPRLGIRERAAPAPRVGFSSTNPRTSLAGKTTSAQSR